MNERPLNLESDIWKHFAGQTENGVVYWRHATTSSGAYTYNYAETIAISHLITRGISMEEAIRLLDADLVIAVPYLPGLELPRLVTNEFIYHIGFTKLTDNTIWEIIGHEDVDLGYGFLEDTPAYGAAATRNLEITEEAFPERIRHLTSVGWINADGRFVAEVIALGPPASWGYEEEELP